MAVKVLGQVARTAAATMLVKQIAMYPTGHDSATMAAVEAALAACAAYGG